MYTSKERVWKDVYFQGKSVEGCILPWRERARIYTSKERVWKDVYFQGESVERCILPKRERRGM